MLSRSTAQNRWRPQMHELAIPLLNRIDLGGPVRHPWDDDDPYAGLAASNPETEHLLGMVSDWARFAYALGCAEWVLVRLAGDLAPWPWQFRDACWAFALDPEYMLPSEIEDHP